MSSRLEKFVEDGMKAMRGAFIERFRKMTQPQNGQIRITFASQGGASSRTSNDGAGGFRIVGPLFMAVGLFLLSQVVLQALGMGSGLSKSPSGSRDPVSILIGVIFSAVFFLFGYIALMYRDTLILNVSARRWSYDQGVWPFNKVRGGAFDQFSGLTLSREARKTKSSSNYTFDVWAGTLTAKDGPANDVSLAQLDLHTKSLSDADARELFGELAKTLGLPLLDDITPGSGAPSRRSV